MIPSPQVLDRYIEAIRHRNQRIAVLHAVMLRMHAARTALTTGIIASSPAEHPLVAPALIPVGSKAISLTRECSAVAMPSRTSLP